MNQTPAGLLVAASRAVGLCVNRRHGLPATTAVSTRLAGLFALLLVASQLAGAGVLRDVLSNATGWAMLSLTIQCLHDVLSARLWPVLRLALQAAAVSVLLALMAWPQWVAAPAMVRSLLVAALIAGAAVSLAPLAADYTPRTWARAVARYPWLAAGLGVVQSTER